MIIKSLAAASIAAAAACVLSGCLVVSADIKGDFHDGDGYLRLLGAEVGSRDREITIVAPSSGCTEKSQFEPRVKRFDDKEVTVGFQRVSEDRCKAFVPAGRRLTWSFAELGIREGASVRILNDIGRLAVMHDLR